MKRLAICFGLACIFAIGALMGHAVGSPSRHRAVYRLGADLYGYPFVLKIRHCEPNPDVMVRLDQVSYDATSNVVVFRCVRP